MLGVRPAALAIVLATAPAFAGCVYANGFYESFDYRIEPVPVAATTVAAAAPNAQPPSAMEVRYARDTARVVFRRRQAERTPDFVSEGADGYAMCLRSGRDYALLVFERRVFEDAISQAADDVRILRSKSDTAVCRDGGLRWVTV